MFCAISGEIPQEPVVSKQSGHVYEKTLILKYLLENDSKCPITNKILHDDDLIALQVNKAVKPRPVATTSIPGLLSSLQNEWDEVMLETFTLKQHLDTTRQELSQALYQHDAACRVIARLMRERDEARAMLTSIQASGLTIGNGHGTSTSTAVSATAQQPSMDIDTAATGTTEVTTGATAVEGGVNEGGGDVIPTEVIEKINAKCKELSATRKTRKPVPEGLLSKEKITGLHEVLAVAPHKTNKGIITCMALHSGTGSRAEGQQQQYTLSGSQDHQSILMEVKTGKIIQRLAGHSKKVTDVAFRSTSSSSSSSFSTSINTAAAMFTSSADKTVKMWSNSSGEYSEGGFSCGWTSADTLHSEEITAIAVHPTGDYVVSMSLDGNWSLLDVNQQGKCIKQVSSSGTSGSVSCDEKNSYICGKFHPDGLILATSTLTTSTTASNSMTKSHIVQDYYNSDSKSLLPSILAADSTIAYKNALQIWDIREQKNVASFSDHNNIIGGISFSENGYFIATACNDGYCRIWDLRKLKCLKSIEIGNAVTNVAFDHSGLYLAVGAGFTDSNNDNSGDSGESSYTTAVGAKISSYGARVFYSKDWSLVTTLPKQHTKPLSALVWSLDSTLLCSASADRYIRVCSSDTDESS